MWIGLDVLLLGSTEIGEGAVIGAKSLVKGTFPNNVTIGGIPAKLIRTEIAWGRGQSDDFNMTRGYSMKTTIEDVDLLHKLLNSDLSDSGICNRIATIYNEMGDRPNYLLFLNKALSCGDAWSGVKYINELKKGDILEQKRAYLCCEKQLNAVSDVNVLNNLNISMADMLFNGLGIEKDMNDAIKHIQYAVDHGHQWSKVLLINYLRQGNTDQKKKAFEQCISYIEEWQLNRDTYAELCRILSTMYYEGNCVEKNLDLAISYLKIAIEYGTKNSDARLFDLLWERGTPDSYSEAYAIVENPANPGFKFRLGKMYHYGRHVSSDIERAVELYKASLDSGFIWAKDELYEALWERPRDGDYVLFNLNHMSALSQLVTLRFTRHADKKAILLADGIFNKSKTYKDLINSGIFDHLIEFDGRIGYNTKSVVELETLIDKYYNDLFEKNNISFSSISDYYTGSDLSNPFAIYLSIQKIPYYLVELSPNQLNPLSRYDGAFKLGYYENAYHTMQKKFGVLCGEEGLPTILYDSASIHPRANIKHSRYEVIDFNKSLICLTDDEKQKIEKCYNLSKNDNKLGIVIFPNSTGYCKGEFGIQRAEFMNVYKTMADYYYPNKEITIKMHPNDTYNPDFDYCPTMRRLNEDMPIEFLRVIDGIEIDTVVTGSTSTVSKIKDISRHVVPFESDYYKAFPKIHGLYIALSIADLIANELIIRTDLEYSLNFINQFAKESGALSHEVKEFNNCNDDLSCLITSSENYKRSSNTPVVISLSHEYPLFYDCVLSYNIKLINEEESKSEEKTFKITIGTDEKYAHILYGFKKKLKLNNLNITLDVKKPEAIRNSKSE